jgi:hypothetical protein
MGRGVSFWRWLFRRPTKALVKAETKAPAVQVPEPEPPEPPESPSVVVSVPEPAAKELAPAPSAASTSLRLYTLSDDYFTPGSYAGSAVATRVLLAPDLAFRLVRPSQSPATAAPSSTPAAKALPAPEVPWLDPFVLTASVFDRERGPGVLTKPEWLMWGRQLRDQVVQNWVQGNHPLDTHDLRERALGLASDPSIALLLCFAVTRAFARGGQAVCWEVQDRSRGQYTDGEHSFTAALRHPAGVLCAGPLRPPSIFYLLFAGSEFGVDDPGDWYRFFAAATAVSFAAGKRTRTESCALDASSRLPAAILTSVADDDPARFGWEWAKALAVAERVVWPRAKTRDVRPVYRRGALFGLEGTGVQANNWDWQPDVHQASSWSDLGAPPTLSAETASAILDTKSPYIRMSGEDAVFQILCNVEEGITCRFTSARWSDPLPRTLAWRIVDDLGWKFVEHSVARQTVVRCALSPASRVLTQLACDRGDGFSAAASASRPS